MTLFIYFYSVEGIMKQNATSLPISECFACLPDPRMKKKVKHNLLDMITILICSVISGANGWTEVEAYGKEKYDWLVSFLELPNGIPSHDTIARLFALIATENQP